MGGTPGMWNTAPKKGGEVLPSPAAAALLPGTVSLGLGPAEAVGGGSRTALCLLFARVCTSVLLGILGCQAANSRLSPLSPLGMCPCHVAATCFASLLLPVTPPRAQLLCPRAWQHPGLLRVRSSTCHLPLCCRFN